MLRFVRVCVGRGFIVIDPCVYFFPLTSSLFSASDR